VIANGRRAIFQTNRHWMRPLRWILLLLSIPSLTQSQSTSISGKVYDASTGMPLTGASVFCQNTTFGTASNSEGRFRLAVPDGGYDLVVTYNGYETFSRRLGRNDDGARDLEIGLKMRDNSLEAVSIVASNEVKDGWERYGGLFRDLFLGMTENSAKCTIENPESLRFLYYRKRDKLKVLAREPVRVVNKALGYRIRFELDSFVHEFGSGSTESAVYALFEEMEGTDTEKAEWKTARENAYYGSLLHFMRCYYDSTLGGNGYRLNLIDPATDKSRLVQDPYDSLTYRKLETGEAVLAGKGRLRVAYTLESPEKRYLEKSGLSGQNTIQVSIIEFPEEIVIEENGYFYDQRSMLVLGYWGWEKLADRLPYDYDPE
jgi:hypothetical protein